MKRIPKKHFLPLLGFLVIYGLNSIPLPLAQFGGSSFIPLYWVAIVLPVAVLLLVFQFWVWFQPVKNHFGWRKSVVVLSLIGLIVFSLNRVVHLIQYANINDVVLVSSSEMFTDLLPTERLLSVSPNEDWMIYGRKSPVMRNKFFHSPEIVVRNLRTGLESILISGQEFPQHGFSLAQNVLTNLNNGSWNEGKLEISNRYKFYRIDPAQLTVEEIPIKNIKPTPSSTVNIQDHMASITDEGSRYHGIAWDGKTFGEYVYYDKQVNEENGSASLWRDSKESKPEKITRFHELFAKWVINKIEVSPDSRFIAIVADKQPVYSPFFIFFWLEVLGRPSTEYLFIYDVHNHRRYKMGEVARFHSPQWSVDSRKFFFAEIGSFAEHQIRVIHFDLPQLDLMEKRFTWLPKEQGSSLNSHTVVASNRSNRFPDWAHFSQGELNFSYPADKLLFSDTGSSFVLSHRVSLPAGNDENGVYFEDYRVEIFYGDGVLVPELNQLHRLRTIPGFSVDAHAGWVTKKTSSFHEDGQVFYFRNPKEKWVMLLNSSVSLPYQFDKFTAEELVASGCLPPQESRLLTYQIMESIVYGKNRRY